jgi:shikimate kinase
VARVVLVGLPGVGKSTLGAALADYLGCAFVDADEAFAVHRGVSVQESLRSEGERMFRAHELEVLAQLLALDAVVATGGGVVTTAAARPLLQQAPTLWVDAPDEVILPRLRDGDRPLLGATPVETLAHLRALRAPLYQNVARWTIDATGPVEELVVNVVKILGEASL